MLLVFNDSRSKCNFNGAYSYLPLYTGMGTKLFPYVIASIVWVSSSGNTNKAVGEVNFRLKEFLLRSLLTKLTFSHRWVS